MTIAQHYGTYSPRGGKILSKDYKLVSQYDENVFSAHQVLNKGKVQQEYHIIMNNKDRLLNDKAKYLIIAKAATIDELHDDWQSLKDHLFSMIKGMIENNKYYTKDPMELEKKQLNDVLSNILLRQDRKTAPRFDASSIQSKVTLPTSSHTGLSEAEKALALASDSPHDDDRTFEPVQLISDKNSVKKAIRQYVKIGKKIRSVGKELRKNINLEQNAKLVNDLLKKYELQRDALLQFKEKHHDMEMEAYLHKVFKSNVHKDTNKTEEEIVKNRDVQQILRTARRDVYQQFSSSSSSSNYDQPPSYSESLTMDAEGKAQQREQLQKQQDVLVTKAVLSTIETQKSIERERLRDFQEMEDSVNEIVETSMEINQLLKEDSSKIRGIGRSIHTANSNVNRGRQHLKGARKYQRFGFFS